MPRMPLGALKWPAGEGDYLGGPADSLQGTTAQLEYVAGLDLVIGTSAHLSAECAATDFPED